MLVKISYVVAGDGGSVAGNVGPTSYMGAQKGNVPMSGGTAGRLSATPEVMWWSVERLVIVGARGRKNGHGGGFGGVTKGFDFWQGDRQTPLKRFFSLQETT